MVTENLRNVLSAPSFLWGWGILTLACLGLLVLDLRRRNPEIPGLMKVVWILTVAYSGPIGLWVYFFSGRKQIWRDSIWRRGWRSVAHCYSGCGAGEIAGIFLAAGILGLSTWWVAGVTFFLAYVAGFAMTVGPLMQEGVTFGTAMKDAAVSESASITVMEVTAIGIDLWLASSAGMGDQLFWSSLVFSLSCGLLAAWPVNVWLIRMGIKEGMHDPREMAGH